MGDIRCRFRFKSGIGWYPKISQTILPNPNPTHPYNIWIRTCLELDSCLNFLFLIFGPYRFCNSSDPIYVKSAQAGMNRQNSNLTHKPESVPPGYSFPANLKPIWSKLTICWKTNICRVWLRQAWIGETRIYSTNRNLSNPGTVFLLIWNQSDPNSQSVENKNICQAWLRQAWIGQTRICPTRVQFSHQSETNLTQTRYLLRKTAARC